MADNKEGKHIQKWIGCPVTDEEFEAHNSKRKELGQTWAEYIMPIMTAQLEGKVAIVECALPANREKGTAKAKSRKVKRSKM